MTKNLWTHNFIRTETPTKLFSCEFCELLTAFLQKTYGRPLSEKKKKKKNKMGICLKGQKSYKRM